MLIDKTHLGWGTASAVVLAVCAAGYVASTSGGHEAAGGSVPGLAFGTLALAAMIFAGLLAVRKKFPGLRLGSAQFWLRGHIWLGLLSVPLVFFHSGFRFGGTLERALMYVFLIVIASGVYGLALQQVLPRVLKVRVPLETFPQQIPALCQRFREDSAKLVDSLKKAAARRASPTTSMRSTSAVSAATAAKTGGAPVKSADKEALAAKLAMMKAGAAKTASAGLPAAKAPTMKGVAAKAVDKGSSVAEKIAAMTSAATAKAAAAVGTEASTPAAIVEPSAAPVSPPSEAYKANKPEKPAKAALDKDAFMAQLAAKKAAAARAKSEAAATPAPADTSVASTPESPAPVASTPSAPAPAAADKPPVGDKAAFMAALAAKKAAVGPAKRREKRTGDDAPATAPGIASADKANEAPMSMMTRVAETGMPRLSLLLRFYENEVLPFFDADERAASRQRVSSENYSRMAFANLAAELPSQALETIEKLEDMVAERRQFLVQVRIQRWLRNWLLIHVPLSAALFLLAALHLIVALRVVPWS